ncbi:hypothetical protein Emed_002337 [Eimeria media]
MTHSVSFCFLEDAACILLKESSWRQCLQDESAEKQQINSNNNAAAFVSCGPEVWKVYVHLSTKLCDLAQQLELPASPIIIPWETETPAEDNERRNKGSGDCSHWAARARAAVLQHYLMTCEGCLRWQPRDKGAQIPLVVDEEFACDDAHACSAWPRHWHLPSSPAACSLEGSKGGPPIECESPLNEGGPLSSERVPAATAFEYTVVAGTFDRLHAGHRLLLAAAVFAASEATGLAVAAGPLVSKKRSSSLSESTADIEPFAFRLRAAAAFVQLAAAARNRAVSINGYNEAIQEECGWLSDKQQQQQQQQEQQQQHQEQQQQEQQQQEQQQQQSVSGGLKDICVSSGVLPPEAPLQDLKAAEQHARELPLRLQVFRIVDSIGPADRLSFDCLVVSAETLRGAHAVNEVRLKLGNKPVSFLTVELVPSCAAPNPHVFKTLHAMLPFTQNTESVHHADRASSEPVSSAQETISPLPAESAVGCPASLAAGKGTSQSKVSSTELRYLHWKQLRCESVTWLCGRFRSSWSWWVRDNSSCTYTADNSSSAVWQLLCAEHAAPWRRLHTFGRIARLLKRLDAEQHSESTEPVVLTIFLGSLLSCPCYSLPRTTDTCATTNCSLQRKASSSSWAPPAEAEWWLGALSTLLFALAFYCCGEGEKDEGQGKGQPLESSAACKHTSLLRDLLIAQRVSSLATLATPCEQTVGKQNTLFMEAAHCHVEGSRVNDEGAAALVKAARRIELLECTTISGSVSLATRMHQQLRDEYFFLEENQFKRWREAQLRQVLNHKDSLTVLELEERRQAEASIKQELEIVISACSAKVEGADHTTS